MIKSEEEIFSLALELPDADERNRFIAEVCPDEETQQRLKSLLDSHRELSECNGTFVLDRAREMHEALGSQPSELDQGQIGPYRIMHLLGEGGMGLVYQAEQLEPLRRRVALKVLKPGMNSRNVLARFELERQALSGMEHPAITRIYDAGLTDSGVPYFAMELVKGLPITEFCAQRQLSPARRIELVISVCHAIQHAHQRGIIHRDIKPANILVADVDGNRQPKVIDFGIAKAINDSISIEGQFTKHGELVGTPVYMSPEQATSGFESVDVRTDVYSMGVLLYELLTGETPLSESELRQRGLAGMRQVLADSRIEPPSLRVLKGLKVSHAEKPISKAPSGSTMCLPMSREKLSRLLRGDLDCLILKSLARDPSERYQSVADLSRDLERYIAGRPIEAVPPSLLYQLRKLALRHRTTAIVTTAAGLLILTSIGVAIGFGFQTLAANQIASDRLKKVLEMQQQIVAERDRAVEAERKTRLLAHSYLAPITLEKTMYQFINQHFDTLCEINPKLASFRVDPNSPQAKAEGFRTLCSSDLLRPHQRVIVGDEEEWLLQILAEVSRKDVKSLLKGLMAEGNLSAASLPLTETRASDADSQEPGEKEDDIPAEVDATMIANGFQTLPTAIELEPEFRFGAKDRIQYLQIVVEALRGFQTPLLANTHDDMGLCYLELAQAKNAVLQFEESIRIRKQFPSQTLVLAQSRLFLAESLWKEGKLEQAKELIVEAQNQIKMPDLGHNKDEIQKLSDLAEHIEQMTLEKQILHE